MVAHPTCNRGVAGSTPVTGWFESVLLLQMRLGLDLIIFYFRRRLKDGNEKHIIDKFSFKMKERKNKKKLIRRILRRNN